jgi:hypothetical protein
MQTDFSDLINAFQAHNWYAVAALVLFFVVNFLKALPTTSTVWTYLQKYKTAWVVPLLIAFGGAFYNSWHNGSALLAAIVAGVAGVVYIGFPAVGIHAVLKNSALPYGEDDTKSP